jgi:hypothetical protein
VILGLSLATVGKVARTSAIREKEGELLFAGDQIRQAIAAYYDARRESAVRYPRSLEDLLVDTPQSPVHHKLRQVYVDPFSGETDWGLIRSRDGGVMGVYSRSDDVPLKQSHFPLGYEGFAEAKSYAEWKFVYGAIAEMAPNGSPQPVPADGGGAQPPVAPTAQDPPTLPVTKGDKKLNCAVVAQRDAVECARQKAQWGEAPECEDTAVVRQEACKAGDPLPPLYIRYQ